MKKILKEVVGVDVDQKKLVVSLGRLHEDLEQEIYARKVFDNNATGFPALLSWVSNLADPAVETCFVMEATDRCLSRIVCLFS